MDDIVVRPRYARHNIPSRRRKKNYREESDRTEKIYRQLLVSVLLLVIAVAVKSVDTPVTGYLSDRFESLVTEDIDLKAAYGKVAGFMARNSSDDGDIKTDTEKGQTSDMVAAPEALAKFRFILPVDGVVTSPFGERISPITNLVEFHEGVDIEAENGSGVRASFDGTVSETGSSRSYGNYLKIRHGNGVETLYAHCSRIIAEKGQQVKQGDTIAIVGNTGVSVGTHLHFEIWVDGKAEDPSKYVDIASI